MKSVLIVDDHPMIRFAARLLLEQHGMKVVGETDNGIEALSLARTIQPNIVILDIGIPKLNGLEVIDRLRAQNPAIKVLVLTSLSPAVYAHRCILAGASGFVSKTNNLNELASAANAVLSGFRYFPDTTMVSPAALTGSPEELPLIHSLSGREITVLKYLTAGLTNKEIAREMLISDKTVSTYKSRLLIKLNARTLVDLIEFANRNSTSL